MIPLLAANFSGLFEGLICVLFQALFVLAMLVYLIRVFVSPPRTGWRGVPRRLAVLAVLTFASVMWAIGSNERSAEIALGYLRYLPIAPVGFALCLLAAQLASVLRKRPE